MFLCRIQKITGLSLASFSAGLLLTTGSAFASASNNEQAKDCPNKPNANIIGAAYDKKTQAFLYCEYYFEGQNSSQLRVDYVGPSSAIIATKRLDFSVNPLAPNVIQEDLRHGELRVVTYREAANHYAIEYRPPRSDADVFDKGTIKAREGLVVDAGFDRAITAAWGTLVQGERASFDFVAVPGLKTYSLIVKQGQSQYCDTSRTENVCFLVKSSSALANWFIQPIALTYDVSNRRLLRFSGDVNITSNTGKSLKADIYYRYQ